MNANYNCKKTVNIYISLSLVKTCLNNHFVRYFSTRAHFSITHFDMQVLEFKYFR